MGSGSIAVARARDTVGTMRFAVLAWSIATGLGGLGCGKSSGSPSDSGTASTPDGPITYPAAGNLDCNANVTDWPSYGQNLCNTNSQATAGGISATNVGTLGVKWVVDFSTVYAKGGDVSATPAVVGGSVYVPDWGGNISKIDAATGNVTWSKSIGALLQSLGDAGSSLPGFISRNTPVVAGGNVIFGALRGTALATSPGPSAYLIAIDQNTAAVKWATLLDNTQAAIIAGSPVVDGNTLYVGVSSQEEYATLVAVLNPGASYKCCTFRGSVVAVDVQTGHIVWKTYTITDALFFNGDAGQTSGWAGNAIWSSTPVVDRKRKQLYVTTGNNYKNVPAEAEAGASEGNYVDAVLALDTTTGAVKWARSFPEGGEDLWMLQGATGQDSDFGAGANLFTATIKGQPKDIVGAGQKSGMYWALDADTGATVWSTQVGPGGHLGGIHWGTATDGTRIYTENNAEGAAMGSAPAPFALGGMGKMAGQMVTTGVWSALDPNTGNILWQIPNPVLTVPNAGASCNGPVAVTNGVLFAGSMDSVGTMFALNAATGDVLWSFASGGTVYGGPAIVNGVVYWGSGYPNGSGARPLGFGSSSMKLYAFALGLGATDGGTADSAAEAAVDAAGDAAEDASSPGDASGQ